METYNYNIGKAQNDKAATFQHKTTGNYLQCQIDSRTRKITNLVNNIKYLQQDK